MQNTNEAPRSYADLWMLDPEVTYLNHGSFGACPKAVLKTQSLLRTRMEREPILFLDRQLEERLDKVRRELSRFVGADPDEIVFVPNATTGVNTVLRSLTFAAGDEMLVSDHEYNACRNALNFHAESKGARVAVVKIPFPVSSPDEVLGAVLERVTDKTRFALFDHVTSPTGMILPIERIVGALAERGIETLVDGAHAPGMVPLDLHGIGASYYTGNCHKWLCAPKGAGFLYVRRELQPAVRPLVISHGANSRRTDRPRFLQEFDWTGTQDFSAWLCVQESIRLLGSILPGGWQELMRRNHEMAISARKILCRALGVEPPCPEEMIGSMASVPLPAGIKPAPSMEARIDPLQDELYFKERIEVPVVPWPAYPSRLIRVSAQMYNSLDQYEKLAGALRERF
jgi:isopenicillin-N epimerase